MARKMVVFNKRTGRYETIHDELYQGTVGRQYNPNYHGQKYRTEAQYNDAMQRMYDKRLEIIRDTEMAGDLDKATVTVDWTDPGMYGRQAAARVDHTYTDRAGKKVSKSFQGPRTRGGSGTETAFGDFGRSGYMVQKEISPDIYSIRRAKVKNMAMKAKSNSRMGLDKLCGRRRF